jgi:CO/xanthine dehydrogenase FAD-binding subunit
MAADVGAAQIQARGTLGGNLATASPAADGVAALAAYDASILVRSARGARTIPFADLQTGYKTSSRAADEVIVAVELALPALGAPWVWRKVGARRAQAISKVALAGVAELAGGRATRFGLGMAAVAPVTARLASVRALATSTPLAALGSPAIERAVEADVAPIDDVRSTREYRLHCAKALVRAWLRQLGDATRA